MCLSRLVRDDFYNLYQPQGFELDVIGRSQEEVKLFSSRDKSETRLLSRQRLASRRAFTLHGRKDSVVIAWDGSR